MPRTVNKMILVGRAGRDAEVYPRSPSPRKVAHVSLATQHTDEHGEERTQWHRLTFRGDLAAFAEENVKKGVRVYVEGRLMYDAYERDGVTIPTAEVEVREVCILSPRTKAAAT